MITLKDYQEFVVHSKCQHMCMVWARRVGKTTTLLECHKRLTEEHPNKRAAIVTPFAEHLRYECKREYPQAIQSIVRDTHSSKSLPCRRLDILFIDEADYLVQDVYESISELMKRNENMLVRAFGTPDYTKEKHFWQRLKFPIGVIVSNYNARACWESKMVEKMRETYTSYEMYRCDILAEM